MTTLQKLRHSLFCASLLAICPAVSAQADLLTDLIAHYPLDGDVTDASGLGNNATNFGATFTADRFGNADSALFCDGNDYVQTPQGSNFKPLSFSVWFRADNVSAERSIVDSDVAGAFGHSLMIGYQHVGFPIGPAAFPAGSEPTCNPAPLVPGSCAWGDGTLDVQFHSPAGVSGGAHDTGESISAGQWYHAVVNYAADIEVFLNGNLVLDIPYADAPYDGSNFRLCRHNASDPQWFIGAIDDVRFFEASLTQSEVSQLFDGGDSDGDGVPDATDNCPDVPNPDQGNNDGDSLGDVCDPDDDNDGIDDVADNCPIDANPSQDDFDGDGLGNVCDPTFIADDDVAAIESEVLYMVELIVGLNVPGGNGLVAKLQGKGGVLRKISSAVEAWNYGLIDVQTYMAELQDALDQLTDFDSQLAEKTANGQIDELDAAELGAASTAIRVIIDELIAATGT